MKDENKSNKSLLNFLFPSYINCNDNNNDNNNSRGDKNKNEKNNNGDRRNNENENKSCVVSGDEVTQNAFEIMMRKIKNKSTFSPTLSSPLTSSNLKDNNINNDNDKNNKNDNGNEVEVEVEDKNLPPSLSSLPLSKQKEWRDNLLYRVCSSLPDLYK